MDIILKSDMSQEHQEIFNRARLNLRLLTLSDIVVADSPSRILHNIFNGIDHRLSSFTWPTSQDIPNEWMTIFQHALRHVIMPHLSNNTLSRWIHPGHKKWQFFASDSNKYVMLSQPTENNCPVDIVLHRRHPIIGTRPPLLHTITPPIQVISPLAAIQSSPKWMHRLWSGVDWSKAPIQNIISSLQRNNLCIVGDGYVKDRRGSYSWCTASKNDLKPFFEGGGPVDGNPNYIKLARTEASHILAMLSLLHVLQQFVTSPSITIPFYADCLTVINYSKQETLNTPSTVLANDIDIMYQVRHMIQGLKFKIEFIHTQPSRIDGVYVPSPEEALLLSRREKAM